VGQEALLSRVFGGRFEALLVWSDEQLASAIEVAQRKNTEPPQAAR
jgi:hypothetical protein